MNLIKMLLMSQQGKYLSYVCSRKSQSRKLLVHIYHSAGLICWACSGTVPHGHHTQRWANPEDRTHKLWDQCSWFNNNMNKWKQTPIFPSETLHSLLTLTQGAIINEGRHAGDEFSTHFTHLWTGHTLSSLVAAVTLVALLSCDGVGVSRGEHL